MFNHPHTCPPSTILVTAGHWTDAIARTGCTVFVLSRPALAVVDIRGGSPGTRETDVLADGALVQHVDALVFSGGSAFGLGVADGVMAALAQDGQGFVTPDHRVPIVPTAIIDDLGEGLPIWPDAAAGKAAYADRVPLESLQEGLDGVGTGATSGKLESDRPMQRGGFGLSRHIGDESTAVTIAVVVNAVGDVVHADSGASIFPHEVGQAHSLAERSIRDQPVRGSTTLVAAFIDAEVDRRTLERIAVSVHDGMARAIRPCHTIFDGDIVFAVGLRSGDPSPVDILHLCLLAERATEEAIIRAVTIGA